MLGETWGQSLIPWGHCWAGDQAAEADPRGGFSSVAAYLEAYRGAIEELARLQHTHCYNAVVMTQVKKEEMF